MPLLQIVIDVSGFYAFVAQPLSKQLLDVFLTVGWIPLAWIVLNGLKDMWLLWRQGKYAQTLEFVLLAVNIPSQNEQSPKAVEHIFSHIAGTHSSPNFKEKWWKGKVTAPISFEFAVIDGYTQFIIGVAVKHRDLLEAAVFSQYPDAEISEIEDYTRDIPRKYPDPEWDVWGTEFTLKKPSPYPIRTWLDFEHSMSQELKDPLSTILESFSKLKKGERLWFQIIAYPISQEWMEEGQNIVAKLVGRDLKKKTPGWARAVHAILDMFEGLLKEIFSSAAGDEKPKKEEKKDITMERLTPGERKIVEGIEMKISKIGMGVKIRVVYAARRDVFRLGSVIAMLKGGLGLFSRHDGNSFKNYSKVMPKGEYFWLRWSKPAKQSAIVENYIKRSGNGADPFILNIEELASLYHFPAMEIKAPMIQKVESRKVEPPFRLPVSEEEEEEETPPELPLA